MARTHRVSQGARNQAQLIDTVCEAIESMPEAKPFDVAVRVAVLLDRAGLRVVRASKKS